MPDLRRPDPGAETFTPALSGVTEVGTVGKSGRFTPAGKLNLFDVTLTPSGGGTVAFAAGAYVTLPFSGAGVATVSDQTSLASIGQGVVSGNRIYLPAMLATTDTVSISAVIARA